MNTYKLNATPGLAVIVVLVAGATPLPAAPPRTPGDSGQPYIAYLFPAGGQRGTTLQVTVGGTHLKGATGVRVWGAGITAKAAGPPAPAPAPATTNAKGSLTGAKPKQTKDPSAPPIAASSASLTLTVAIAPDAELGEREVRVMTPDGVSNAFRFIVGQLPEVVEKEPNDEPAPADPQWTRRVFPDDVQQIGWTRNAPDGFGGN